MSSAMVSQTLQGAVLSVTSNILAQAISSYKDNVCNLYKPDLKSMIAYSLAHQAPFSISLAPIIKFAVFSIVSNPPNIIWQTFLEDSFPTNVPASTSQQKLNTNSTSEKAKSTAAFQNATQTSKTNILIKFLLDQSIGALVNTLMFLGFMTYVHAAQQGQQDAWGAVVNECQAKTWPMMKDGYKFWPLISLISFVWVPVDKRVVFGCSVGVIWGVYLSLLVDG